MLPPDDLLLADLTAPTWGTVTGVPPKIQVEKKEDLVARLGRSPDHGDAVVMAFWADTIQIEGSFTGAMPLMGVDLTRGLSPGHTGWGR